MLEHLAPPSRLGLPLSTLIVNGLAGFALILWVGALILLALRCRRRAARLDRLPNGEPDPVDASMIYYGSVDPTPGESPSAPVIAVTIEQSGTLTRSFGKQRMFWIETDRKESVRHFDLLLSSSVRVRVKPGTTVSLYRPLDTLAGAAPTRRRRSARLMRGNKVYVLGTLGPGAGSGSALRPLEGRPLAISDEPFGEVHRRRMHHHVKFAALGVLSLLAIHLGLVADFHVLQARGEVVTALVVDLRPGGPWLVTALPPGSHQTITDETHAAAFAQMRVGSQVPFTCDRREGGVCEIGRREFGIHWAAALGILAVLVAQVASHSVLARRAIPWSERDFIHDSEVWFG